MRPIRKKTRDVFLHVFAIPNTLLFNFWYFPFKVAVRLPVLVSHRVWLMQLSGTVSLTNTRIGAIKIGFGEVGIFDQHRSRSIWKVSGTVEFKGKANLGHGSKIDVSGKLTLGDRLNITAESAIIAQESITIGDQVTISWDTLIMDTDFHDIHDASGAHINPSQPIRIGNHVWIGCRATILKGVDIADGVIVAASATLASSIDVQNSIVAGNPARVIRKDVTWGSPARARVDVGNVADVE